MNPVIEFPALSVNRCNTTWHIGKFSMTLKLGTIPMKNMLSGPRADLMMEMAEFEVGFFVLNYKNILFSVPLNMSMNVLTLKYLLCLLLNNH